MRVLVTGAHGFVGRHVLRELHRSGHTSLSLVHPAPEKLEPDNFACDLQDAGAIQDLVRKLQPDACIHLAGIAFVPTAWSNPQSVFHVNVLGTINLLEAFRMHRKNAHILVISSSQVYGNQPTTSPLPEDARIAPVNLYAISKLTADLTSLLYARQYQMHVMTARPCNHIGPGQSNDFAVAAFAEQVAAMEAGRAAPILKVGNLDSERDFLDVRDVAHAYRLLMEKGHAGEAYNIAGGHCVKIRTILETLCEFAGVRPTIEVDPARYRPADTQPLLDTTKIAKHTQWKPEIELKQSLRDILDDKRQGLKRPS